MTTTVSPTHPSPDDLEAADASVVAPPRTRWAARALALGAGVLVALAMPPWGFWPLAIVGIALFEIALRAGDSRRSRAAIGWFFGAGWMFLAMGWMVQLTGPGYVVAGAIFAAFHAVAAAFSPSGPTRTIVRPALHTLVEALRFSFPFGGVPLASLGISQVAGPIGVAARVGGVILITWIVFQIGFAVGAIALESIHRREQPQPQRSAATWVPAIVGIGVALVIVGVAAGIAPRGSDTGRTLRIAAVQGGGEQGTSALEVPSILVTERHLAATRTIQADPALDLVFWPENTIDVVTFESSEIAADIIAQSARLGIPISVGLTEDVMIDGRRRYTNAQVVVTPSGQIASRYDKVRRVPFGEYVPLRGILERITSAVDQVGDAVAGTEPAVLELPSGDRFSTVISWEVFFGGRVREGVRLGAGAILNPTNGASYTGTIVQTQQIASSRLRAIETGRWVVQAAPTGYSAFVSPDGTVIDRTTQREQTVIIHDIEMRSGSTWYVSLGDAPFIVALLVIAAAGLFVDRRPSTRLPVTRRRRG